jgi:hypothetical protein
MRRSTRYNRPGLTGSSRSAMLLGADGDGSTLSLDFTTGSLDPRCTFIRNSQATYINSQGYVATMAAAPTNDPTKARFDYDPITLAPRGLLVEGQATNLLQYSEAVDQSPWFTAGTVARATFTGGNGPNGVNNSGSKLSATSISASSSLYYNGVSLTAQTYTMSVFAKADGANWIWINVQSGGTIHGAFFDLSGNGALGNTTGTVVSGSNIITKYPNGWFRIQFTFTGTAAFWFPVLLPCTSNGTGYASIAGQAPNGVLVYGCMFETGSGASSYIPTVASTATRVADFCVMTGTNFSSWYQGGTQGTFYADWFGGVRAGASGSTNRTVLSTDDVANKHLHLMQTAAAGNLRLRDFGGANQITTANTLTSGARTKGAFGYNGSSASVCLNGGTVATGSSLAFSVTPTWLVLGATSTNGTSLTDANVVLNNSIRQIKYWPTRLPDSTIQNLTL